MGRVEVTTVRWLLLIVLLGLGCSVKRVPLRDPASSGVRAPYDFEGEKPAPPPPDVQAAPAGARLDSVSLETAAPADLDAPAVQVQDLAAPPRPAAAAPSGSSAPAQDLAGVPGSSPATPPSGSTAGTAGALAPNGYRVQIFATTDAAAAESMRHDIEVRLGTKAYVEFQAPYHKVRVGNCTTHEACRDLQTRLQQAGYASVWIVPSPVEP